MGAKRRTRRTRPECQEPSSTDLEPQLVEVMRVGISDGRPFISLAPVEWLDSPERWGSLLCDTLLNIANAYSLVGDYDFERTACRIFDGLHQRLRDAPVISGTLMNN